jgi:hypothetical protein
MAQKPMTRAEFERWLDEVPLRWELLKMGLEASR